MVLLTALSVLVSLSVPIFLIYAIVQTLRANTLRNKYLKEINERLKKLTSN